MEELNFFNYLGLDQYHSDEEFLLNLKRYDHRIIRSEHNFGMVIIYESCEELKEKYIDKRLLILNQGFSSYLAY